MQKHRVQNCPNRQEELRRHDLPLWEFFLSDDYSLIRLEINEEIGLKDFIVDGIVFRQDQSISLLGILDDHLWEKSIIIHHSLCHSRHRNKLKPISKILQNLR